MRPRALLGPALAAACIVAGCAGRDEEGRERAPAGFTFSGSAEGADPVNDVSAECELFAIVLDLLETEEGWAGETSGEVTRTVLVGSTGGQFQALTGGPAAIALTSTGAALQLFGDQAGGAPFWVALETLEGTATGRDSWAGDFDCAPLDLQLGAGVSDTSLTVSGTWTLATLEE